MLSENSSEVFTSLQTFRSKVNANGRARKLLQNWEPLVIVESTDASERYFLRIRDTSIQPIEFEGDDEAEHSVHIRGTSSELAAVFCGEKNAARSVLNADLEVFAADKDQVKLDAISMVIWGI